MASIIDRGKGRPNRWQVKYRKPNGRQASQSFATLDEAKRFRAQVEGRIYAGTYVDPDAGRISFGGFCELRAETLAGAMRPSSAARWQTALDVHVLPYWADVRLSAIGHDAVQNWIDELRRSGNRRTGGRLAPATVRKAWQVFRSVIGAAIAGERLTREPWGELILPAIPYHEARFLEPAEVDRLADAIGDEWRAFVYVGALCGLRAGELFGLRWRDVDVDRGFVEVREIVTEANGRQHVGEPKTAASRRRVPLPAVVLDEIELHRLTAADPDGLVFPTDRGGPWRATNFRNRIWKPAVERAGLSGLVIHELRHTAVAAWIDAGATPNEVAARAGHGKPSFTLDRYGHRFPTHGERVNDGLDRLYSQARATRKRTARG